MARSDVARLRLWYEGLYFCGKYFLEKLTNPKAFTEHNFNILEIKTNDALTIAVENPL